MKARTIVFILLAVILTLFTIPAYATDGVLPPAPVPHAFYGAIEINGEPAPIGTEIEARGEGVLTGVGGNPVIVTIDGRYGSLDDPFEPKLIVWGEVAEGATLTFYVNSVATGRTAEWHSGEVTEIDLAATIEGPPPGTTEVTDIISSTGLFTEAVNAESSDGLCRLKIAQDTIGLINGDEPLSEIKMVRVGAPPAPPTDARMVGSVYDLKPDGATFNPAATLEYTYDPSRIPAGVSESELVLAWWDVGAGSWVELESTANTEADTITATVSHFTTFGVMAYLPPEPELNPAVFSLGSLTISPEKASLGESVTISVEVTNTGGEVGNYAVILSIDGVLEDSQDITVSAGDSQQVSFTTVKNLPGGYAVDVNGLNGTFEVMEDASSVPPAPLTPPPAPVSPVNWPVLWGVIGGVVMVGLMIFLLARKKAY